MSDLARQSGWRDLLGAIGGVGAASFFSDHITFFGRFFVGFGHPTTIIPGPYGAFFGDLVSGSVYGCLSALLGSLVVNAFVTRGRWLARTAVFIVAALSWDGGLILFHILWLGSFTPGHLGAWVGALAGSILGVLLGRRRKRTGRAETEA